MRREPVHQVLYAQRQFPIFGLRVGAEAEELARLAAGSPVLVMNSN